MWRRHSCLQRPDSSGRGSRRVSTLQAEACATFAAHPHDIRRSESRPISFPNHLHSDWTRSTVRYLWILLAAGLLPSGGAAQEDHADMHHGMQMNHMQMNASGMFMMNMASGTGMNPLAWRMPMFMPRLGSWNLMLMGQAFLVETQP